jgi:phosphatidylserine/phosphatidylglycerophosphate/cardiolipin synthase-like enzyme
VADALLELAKVLSPTQATSVAASIEIDGRLDYAVATLPGSSHPAASCLKAALEALGSPAVLASVLRGFAAAGAKAPNPPRAVWSGPSFDGDSDHTTAAVAYLIDEATEDVFASTFSASLGSPFVDALWRAIARGVAVTVLIDGSEKMTVTAAKLVNKLDGARFLIYVPEGSFGLQHSKVVIVDSAIAFVTSANLSEAAAYRNLETGVVVRDTDFASKLRQRFRMLESLKTLVDFPDQAS